MLKAVYVKNIIMPYYHNGHMQPHAGFLPVHMVMELKNQWSLSFILPRITKNVYIPLFNRSNSFYQSIYVSLFTLQAQSYACPLKRIIVNEAYSRKV